MWVAGVKVDRIPKIKHVDILNPNISHLPGATAQLSPAVLTTLKTCIVVNSTAELRAQPCAQTDGGTRIVEVGNRTECALLRLACYLGADIDKDRASCDVVAALPFSSERKCMSVLVCSPLPSSDPEYTLYCKGAAEVRTCSIVHCQD